MTPPNWLCDELGERDGCKVEAVTDATGSHVILTGRLHKISPRYTSHEKARAAGRAVMKRGLAAVTWDEPFDSVWTIMFAVMSRPQAKKRPRQ